MTSIKKIKNGKYIGKIDFDIVKTKYKEFRLRLIFVKPEFRGKDYGKELLKFAIKIAKENNCDLLSAYVSDSPFEFFSDIGKREKFFKKFGFNIDEHGLATLKLREIEMSFDIEEQLVREEHVLSAPIENLIVQPKTVEPKFVKPAEEIKPKIIKQLK